MTFDADGTLYADGMHFEDDNNMIIRLFNSWNSHTRFHRHADIRRALKFEGRLKVWMRSRRKRFRKKFVKSFRHGW